jgi:hypothetical protein
MSCFIVSSPYSHFDSVNCLSNLSGGGKQVGHGSMKFPRVGQSSHAIREFCSVERRFRFENEFSFVKKRREM